MPLSRHQRRSYLAQAIFLWEDTLKRGNPEAKTKESQKKLLQYVLNYESEDFEKQRFFGVIENIEKIRTLLAKHAPDFPVERIANMDRAILYLGIYELLHTDIPPAVVMDEAVELAKEFGAEPGFVNGVLSSINKKNN